MARIRPKNTGLLSGAPASRQKLPSLRRRSFLKIGVSAYAAFTAGCSSRGRLTQSAASRTLLLKGERDSAPSVCTLCPSGCAIRAFTEGDRIVAVGGDPEDPNTGGKMCAIGLSMLNLHANPDRITGPFRKDPAGKMTPAKAEHIFSAIAGRIRQGAALHIYGRITPYTSLLSRALNATCHLDPETMSAYSQVLNTDGRPPIVDFENARTAFLFGSNILEHGFPFVGYARKIADARLRGFRLVSLSPFLTNTATAGDWIPLRSHAAIPASAFAIAQHAANDPTLKIAEEYPEILDVLRAMDKNLLEEVSGLSRETIGELAARFFNEPGPAYSDRPDASVLLLNLMKGNFNRPGGLFHPGQRSLNIDADCAEIGPILQSNRNIVFLHQANLAFDRASQLRPILHSREKALLVCVDSFMSETAELSDFVLPLASPLETLTITEPLPIAEPYMVYARPAAKPAYGCCSFDDWLAQLLAVISGSAPPVTPEDFARGKIHGASSAPVSPDRAIYPIHPDVSGGSPPKLLEPNRQIYISELKMQAATIRNLPALQPDQFFPTAFEESVQGPLTAPSKWLDEITYAPKIWLNPQRAGGLGIRSGDMVTINADGADIDTVAQLFEGVHPDAVAVPRHHGHTGYGRVALGESFQNSKDPDMERMFWGKSRGINAGEISGEIVAIRKKRG